MRQALGPGAGRFFSSGATRELMQRAVHRETSPGSSGLYCRSPTSRDSSQTQARREDRGNAEFPVVIPAGHQTCRAYNATKTRGEAFYDHFDSPRGVKKRHA